MAPITRTSSQVSGGIAKKAQRKRPTRKEPSNDWDFTLGDPPRPKTNGTSHHEEMPRLEEESSIDDLREMAERVGKGVEAFAVTLDEFFNELPTVQNSFDAAYDLVLKFRDIANGVVDQLRKRHESELRQQLRQEWRDGARVSVSSSASRALVPVGDDSLSAGARKAAQVEELRSWQQEADIWDLFRIMLELHPFEADARARQQEREELLAKIGPPHRYMSESELWERFLLEDDVANERNLIKQWLERTADHQETDLEGIMEELETKAGRGKGLWSSGWLHTREKIKGEKRLRTWPNAAESPLPQIRRSDNNDLLVTTLDPDAPTRQHRTLEKPDSYFERAMWVACWEMLRRGVPWEEIAEWCEERKEGWRVVCLSAAAYASQSIASSAAFRSVCQRAAQSGLASDHETAVFGLLGGDVTAVERICRTVDDHLYAYYSANLLKQFDSYLQQACPEKAASALGRSVHDDSLHDPAEAERAITQLILKLRQAPNTNDEAVKPMKIIQSYLLADEVGSLVHTVGAAIAETAALQGPEDVIFLHDKGAEVNAAAIPEREVALDARTLRIAAHMSIVHRALSPNYLATVGGDELMEDENVLVAYIQALRTAGKRDLIPIYASKLTRARYIIVLGRLLHDITEMREQERMLKLLQEYDLDVKDIVQEQLLWTLDHQFPEPKDRLKPYSPPPFQMLERTSDTKLHPGQQIILNFLSDEIAPEDEALVRCLQWFHHMQGGWELMFDALSRTVTKCLINGRMSCARLIVGNFPFEQVSERKSYESIGRAVNVMTNTTAMVTEHEDLALDLFKKQSNTYYELTQLIDVIESLDYWRTEEHKYINAMPKPSSVPNKLREAFKDVSGAMQPILRGILRNPRDDAEETELAIIRNHYIPEIVIAYNTVLHAAGNLITRDNLLTSMDLSVTVANGAREGESGNGLEECFVKAGRVRELVESFAWTSKAMLVLKAEGKQWKPKHQDAGKDLGMWEIGSGDRVEDGEMAEE